MKDLVIRCSGLHRPMKCAGFLFFENLPPQDETAPAREGTACGELLESMLMQRVPGTHAKNGVAFDDDMHFYAREFADQLADRADSKINCEQRIDWQTRSGIWIRGSYDISYTIDNGDTLCVDDLKYGWGVVEVFENWQLLGYAIGEVIRQGKAFKKIILRIHQPRPHHEEGPTREWVLTYPELLDYKEKIDARMDDIANGLRTLTTGPQCKYCPAAGEACPAIGKAFFRSIEVAHEFTQDKITPEELAFQLDLVARAEEILKIKSNSLSALAIDRIRNKTIIPGYIMEESYGDRKWKASLSPDLVKMMTGKDITEKVMLSPAKAEKLGVPKDFVNSMVDRFLIGNKLKKKDAGKTADKIFGKNPLEKVNV